jgi:uncharacterized membrane protein
MPTFYLLASPYYLTMGQGSAATSTITVNSVTGFGSYVNLTVSGLPSGVTASVTPNPSYGISVLTFNANGSAATGSAAVTIQGTCSTPAVCGTLYSETQINLTVAPLSFTLGASPASLSMTQGAAGTSTIAVTPQYGFTGNVNLAVSGLPAGVTASFTPNPTTGTSVLTVTASNSAIVGTYNVTVTGTSGTLSATAPNLVLQITPAPNFTLAASPTSLTVAQSASGTDTLTVVDQGGFAGNVNLTASGLPAGVTASFFPNPTTGSSVLTLTANSSAPLGTNNPAITGTSGAFTASTSLALTIIPPAAFTPSSTNFGTVNIGTARSLTV